MRALMLAAALLSGCGKPPDGDIVDISELGTVSPAASGDAKTMIAVDRPQLSRCAEPFRAAVRRGDPGYGSVSVVLGAVGERGRDLEIRSVSLTPRFGPVFDSCVASVLRGTEHVIASGDYALNIRLRLCIDPLGAP